MTAPDTIVALSTGSLPSGVAVVRLSGPKVRSLLEDIAGGVPQPRCLVLRRIGADTLLDRGLVAFFPAPHSFTGEDCAELQLHGSPAGIRATLRLLVSKGARLAAAGEFTRRAFENGKLDLTAVEGLGDLLQAETENQRRQALRRLEGGLSQKVEAWRLAVLDLRAEIEARLDFSDEGDVEDELPHSYSSALEHLQQDLSAALAAYTSGRITREGIRVALGGAPNVGKSSLLNAIARSEIAIVTDEAGTTRDVREVPVDLDGQLFIFLDLAGLRETTSKAEAEGIRRAYSAIQSADILLWLQAPDVSPVEQPSFDGPVIAIATKADLAEQSQGLALSVQTGAGFDDLLSQLKMIANELGAGEPYLLSHERDKHALEEAISALIHARQRLSSPELAAEDLRQASYALERLVGRIDTEHVLDRLFSSFCIGK